ncbi:MAG: hypothetical protein HLUCCA01_06760 [Bacteroidetes bacterium HLUCCA01]|nr:MAG: hypothetical protein HLUCCA01_06760 [Bacteroidetes bacterium HLUCCA01]
MQWRGTLALNTVRDGVTVLGNHTQAFASVQKDTPGWLAGLRKRAGVRPRQPSHYQLSLTETPFSVGAMVRRFRYRVDSTVSHRS